jgi:uncharacterized protein (TIRG00374 family)
MNLLINKNTYRFFFGVLLILISFFYLDWKELFNNLNINHFYALIIVQPLQVLSIYFLSRRFSILSGGIDNKEKNYFKAYLLSIGLNTFIPARLSELVKITYMKKKGNLSTTHYVSALILERYLDIIFLVILMFLGTLLSLVEFNQKILSILIILIGLIFILFFFNSLVFQKILNFLKKFLDHKYYKIIKDFFDLISKKIFKLDFLYSFFLSLIVWAISFLLVFIILKYLHGELINVYGASIIFLSLSLSRIIPGLPANIGTFETAIVFSMSKLGFNINDAFLTAITIHLSQIIFPTIISLIIFTNDGIGIKSFLKLTKNFVKND